ncbi:MAG: leucine--tRNA ligase [Candidatus Gracilibacteria bacterium]|jgi:leucyl-tRNA synthetase
MQSYNALEVEKKWQAKWRESGLHKANLASPEKEKYYNLTMFPYPSGDKLHIGHWYNYGPVDTWGRYMKMKGYEVFQPMGFDSFGLPAENYAIKTGVHPAETTRANIDKMKQQIGAIGGMYDLEPGGTGLETSSPEYYKWTQWLFLQLYKNGLAYRKEAPVNWCPGCMTVLANEQVDEGKCERCKSEVVQKNLRQWFFKITSYADKLLDYEGLEWPEKTVLMQKHWIGRKEGINITYKIKSLDEALTVFTTRPETNFGASFVVISPEHPQTLAICAPEQKAAVVAYLEETKKKSELDRQMEGRKKTGVFTGAYAINELTGYEMPVYTADYALMGFGTGVVVGVPGHDLRDFEFAEAMGNIEIIRVIKGPHGEMGPITCKEEVQEDEGEIINSEILDGLTPLQAIPKMMDYLESRGMGKRVVNFRLRDWLISRQRYWGAPIPIIYCEKCGEVAVPDEDLPVVHPHVEDYVPKGTSPLAGSEEFVNVKCPRCSAPAKREVDTMDTFVCSSWYFLRYPDAGNAQEPWSKDRVNQWMPVDMYIGGPEHACMHLLYARFIHKVMHDLGFVEAKEPFKRLVHQGMVTKDGAKMSKSKGNVVSPDEFVNKYGSDVFRMYLMFMGPFTDGGDWNDRGITGVARFVDRFYRMMQVEQGEGMDEQEQTQLRQVVHQTVARASEAVANMNFNVAIAALMELTNKALEKGLNKEQKEIVTKILAPLAPHLAEEVWAELGHKESVFNEEWPKADPQFLVKSTVTYAVQVNGKLRATLDLPIETSKEEALATARAHPNAAKFMLGEIVKEIFVPGKIIGFVVK